MRCTENCNACSQHGSTEGPDAPHDNARPHGTQPALQKLNELGYNVLPHPVYSPDLSPTNYQFFNILTPFCKENTSTTNSMQKMLSKSSSNPKVWIFMLQEKTNLFLIGKNVVIVIVPILFNKDVFEPSYSDLKFMVWNSNYFITNLNSICC